jgi:choline dehydrogenase-like flavoprotein
MKAHHIKLFSAHVMGGCAMGADPKHSVVDLQGNHRLVDNLTVIDGSIFPTAIGANPSLPIYTLAAWQAEQLVARLG